MSNEPVAPADHAAVLSDLQDSSRYADLVLSLRSDHRLHPFVEWRLEHVLRAHHAGQMHVQAEKNGISNGRIDLVAYGGTRSVIHFELISSNSGGHVFRDTTSLLGSKADARLAVLIDEDLDPDVCKNYKRAIPLPTIVEDVPLRTVLLKRNEAAFNDLLRRLLGRAAFRGGSLRLEGFRCELDSYELQPLSEVTLRYRNAPARSRLRVRLRTTDDVVDIIGGSGLEIPEGDGQVPFWIPLREEISRGEHRLEAALDSGVRWAANVTVPSLPPTPSLLLDPSAAHVGATVNFRVQHFPQDTELRVTFWQGHSGRGVFTGMLGATGELSGSFRIPPIVNGGLSQPGWHNLEASTYRRPASARAQINVPPLPEDQALELADSTTTSSNAQASLSISTVRVQPARLSLAVSILSLVRDYPIRLQSISAQISAKHGFYSLVTEPFPEVQGQILQPHSPYQATHVFVVDQRLPASNPPEVPRLDLQAVIGLGEHFVAVLRIARPFEESLLEHLLRNLGQP